jgi:hypothetical protein
MQSLKRQKNLGSKHKRLLMASVVIAALAIAALFICGIKGQYLLLINEHSGHVLFYAPAAQGSEFAVSFTHSVNKSSVTEYYRIKDGQICLEALRYYTFGAGMPTELMPGQTMRHGEEGAIIIEGFERPLAHLVYVIGYTANHTLYWQDREIPLNTLDMPGQPVLFSLTIYPRLWLALRVYSERYVTS